MARKGNQRNNGLGGSTSSHKKGGLQSVAATPNKKQKASMGNTKDVKMEEHSSDAQPSAFVIDALHKPSHAKEHKKKTRKYDDQSNVEIQSTAGASNAQNSEPCHGTFHDCNADISTTATSCLDEHQWASANGILRSKNRKFESVELPETLGVRYLKTFVSLVSKASTEWLHKHRPLLDILVTKILVSRDYVRMKIKHAYPIILKWIGYFTSILLVLSMVWLDCTLRGIDSVIRMGTTSFFTVIWCSIFSMVAMIGMLKFITVVAIVALVGLFVGFTLGLLLLAVSGIVFLWLYGSFWITFGVLVIGGVSVKFSHERVALLIMTLYSVYTAWTLVGWLGIFFALNLSFFSSDLLILFLRNNVSEQRANNVPEQTAGTKNRPGVVNGEKEHAGGGSHPQADHGFEVPSTSGSESEDEVARLLNSADHYSALGLSRFQEIDVTYLKREYRKKAMVVHPDKNMGNEKAVEAFKKLQNAYEVLLDASKQKAYDDELRREDLLNYFRRFQNATPKNKRDGFFGSSFGSSEVYADNPSGESRRIACQKCGSFHMWFYSKKTKSRARSCQECKDFHPAKDGDGWVEQSSQPFLFGIFQKVDTPRAYVCADSKIYDATEWYLCQGMRCSVNTHKPSFHVNTSVMSKHSNNKGASSSHRGGGMPNMDEIMTEEEFVEWLQNAVQSGMFDNFEATNGGSPSNSSKNGSSSKRKKKGKKW